MTVTLQADDGRDTLRLERRLAHAPERVWRAITDPGELEAWFPSMVAYDQRLGAPMTFDFRSRGFDFVLEGRCSRGIRRASSRARGARTSCASSWRRRTTAPCSSSLTRSRGSIEEPGKRLAAGALRDPLAGARVSA